MKFSRAVASDQKPSTAAEEPTIYTVASKWVGLNEKLSKLLALQDELGVKINSNAKISNKSDPNRIFAINNVGPYQKAAAQENQPRMTDLSKRVADLLGEFAPPSIPAPDPLAHEPAHVREARELSFQSTAVQEAINAIHSQLRRAHLEGSAQLCDLLRPRYKEIAARMCAVLVELGNAELEHREFMHRHRNAALATLRIVHGTGSLGDPRDPHCELRRLLEWAAECGHYNLADLPPEWGSRKSAPGSIRSWPVA
jgi:hypothetical protein